jgi:hypothetical protein
VLVLVLVSAGSIEEDILGRASQKRDIDAKVIQVRRRTRGLERCAAAQETTAGFPTERIPTESFHHARPVMRASLLFGAACCSCMVAAARRGWRARGSRWKLGG